MSLTRKAGQTVLHLLSQRPTLTGSGTTLDVMVREAATRGWDQHGVVGVPAQSLPGAVGPLPPERVHPLLFETQALPFPVPGMSDVMPYPSTRFSSMDDARWGQYRDAWRRHLEKVAKTVHPDMIHSHHLWLMSSLVKNVFPDVPVIAHCHATDLRQMELCPDRTPEIVQGLRRCEAVACLHGGQVRQIADALDIDETRIHVVGAGYREDLFHPRGRGQDAANQLVYVGKLSHAKGLPSLLDAVERLAPRRPGLSLHIAGSGAGGEAETLGRRLEALNPLVTYHGQLDQGSVADLLRHCAVCVLPSFYEGLPLVLVEAAACGCRVVATALPGVLDPLAPALGDSLHLVGLPTLATVDTPVEAELPAFVDRLEAALEAALDEPDTGSPPGIEAFTWEGVFGRIERVWTLTRGAAPKPTARDGRCGRASPGS